MLMRQKEFSTKEFLRALRTISFRVPGIEI